MFKELVDITNRCDTAYLLCHRSKKAKLMKLSGTSSDVFKSNQKVELSNQTWANNSNCEANHSNRISANSMRMPIAFSLGFSL